MFGFSAQQQAINKVIEPQDLSEGLLASIYESESIKVSEIAKGYIKIYDGFPCLVCPSNQNDFIQLCVFLQFYPHVNRIKQLNFANNINQQLVMLTASVLDDEILKIKYDLHTEGGICHNNLINGTRRFLDVVYQAVGEHQNDICHM